MADLLDVGMNILRRTEELVNNELMNEFQSAFHTGHPTKTAILNVQCVILSSLDRHDSFVALINDIVIIYMFLVQHPTQFSGSPEILATHIFNTTLCRRIVVQLTQLGFMDYDYLLNITR